MQIKFTKYQGAGNDFVIVDNRDNSFQATTEQIERLCDRRFGVGGDGFMLLEKHPEYDFVMRYFNSDGREASMCGNGGRCIVAFAKQIGVIDEFTRFLAVDGEHEAYCKPDGDVDLKMIDVDGIEVTPDFYFMDTGSPHYVEIRESIQNMDVYNEGRAVRYNERFKADGTNVNFVQKTNNHLDVYTYERGVEDETLACGTGITASALAAAIADKKSVGSYDISAKGGKLSVRFESNGELSFKNVWLKGPATFVFEGSIEL